METKAKRTLTVNKDGISALAKKIHEKKEEQEKICCDEYLAHHATDEPVSLNPIFDSVEKEKDAMCHLTNFEAFEVKEIYRLFQAELANEKSKKGPKPAITNLDAIVLTLYIFKTAQDYSNVSYTFFKKISGDSSIHVAVNRVVPILLKCLSAKWWQMRIRPKKLEGTVCPDAALLIDSTSFQIKRPSGQFANSMCFFDGKNHKYALKKEVAVMARHPHYALFASPSYTGSCHDERIHQEMYKCYETYLRKSAFEADDHSPAYWEVVADMGYIGETVGSHFRKITPAKGRVDKEAEKLNGEISKVRVHVER